MDNAEHSHAEASKDFRALCSAYRQVFGVEGRRTDAQTLVWKDLEVRGYLRKPIFVPIDGKLDPLRAAWADGARGYFLQIDEFLRSGEEEPKRIEVKK